MKALVCLILIPAVHPRFQRPPFVFEVKGIVSYLEALQGFPMRLVVCLHFWVHRSDLQHSHPLGWPFYCDHSWAGFISHCSLQCGRKQNATFQQQSFEKDMADTVLLVSWTASTSHHLLHHHFAYTTLFPTKHFNSKGYLQFLEALPRRSAFPGAICEKEHSPLKAEDTWKHRC